MLPKLSDKVFVFIFGFLDVRTLCRVESVCREFHSIVDENLEKMPKDKSTCFTFNGGDMHVTVNKQDLPIRNLAIQVLTPEFMSSRAISITIQMQSGQKRLWNLSSYHEMPGEHPTDFAILSHFWRPYSRHWNFDNLDVSGSTEDFPRLVELLKRPDLKFFRYLASPLITEEIRREFQGHQPRHYRYYGRRNLLRTKTEDEGRGERSENINCGFLLLPHMKKFIFSQPDRMFEISKEAIAHAVEQTQKSIQIHAPEATIHISAETISRAVRMPKVPIFHTNLVLETEAALIELLMKLLENDDLGRREHRRLNQVSLTVESIGHWRNFLDFVTTSAGIEVDAVGPSHNDKWFARCTLEEGIPPVDTSRYILFYDISEPRTQIFKYTVEMDFITRGNPEYW